MSPADPLSPLLLRAWSTRPEVLLVLTGLAALYVTGWSRLRRRGPGAAGVGTLAAYLAGLGAIALALLSPIDTFGSWLFSLHMLQHQLLAMVAAPLILLGNPVVIGLWGLPARLRRRAGAALARRAAGGRTLAAITRIPVPWVTYMAVLVAWHLPVAFQAALAAPPVHDAQHLSFFLAGLLFWWPVVSPAPRPRGHIPYGVRMVYVLASLLIPMVPVMSLVLVDRLFYPHYSSVPRLWGLTPLQDQQTGWVAMAVVDSVVYGTAFFALLGQAFRHEERQEAARLGIPIDVDRPDP